MFGSEDFENSINMQQVPVTDKMPEIPPAQNEQYGDFIVKYARNIFEPAIDESDVNFQAVDGVFGVLYVPLSRVGMLEINDYTYNAIPKCYTYMDTEALESAGISRLQNHPFLKLQGEGTAVAVIDSGIDYNNPVFKDGDSSRIICIWDQTLTGGEEEGVPYGRVFYKEEIDQAISSENPLEIVPSTDENGHGTALAGLAAGNTVLEENFSGAAPKASLIIIKLKPAKTYLREFYQFPPDVPIHQENDIMLAISFAMKFAGKMGLPLSVCLGVGTSQGAHTGGSPLERYLDYLNEFARTSVSVAAGNEGASRHHYVGQLSVEKKTDTAELRVAEGELGFSMECWGEPLENYMVSIQSPTGEILEVSSSIGAETQPLSFVFVETRVFVNYVAMERYTGKTLVYFRFFHPAPGIWKITTGIKGNQSGTFHMWLPVEGLISRDTYFLQSNPYNTVTAPGNSTGSITVTAYQYKDDSLYFRAGRGFTPDGRVTPDIAAPGVDLKIPLVGKGFGTASGTSLAAGITAGAAALMFEWAIVRGNAPYFPGGSVKHYMQKGAKRDDSLQYPNPEWGFGRLDLYHTFELLR